MRTRKRSTTVVCFLDRDVLHLSTIDLDSNTRHFQAPFPALRVASTTGGGKVFSWSCVRRVSSASFFVCFEMSPRLEVEFEMSLKSMWNLQTRYTSLRAVTSHTRNCEHHVSSYASFLRLSFTSSDARAYQKAFHPWSPKKFPSRPPSVLPYEAFSKKVCLDLYSK